MKEPKPISTSLSKRPPKKKVASPKKVVAPFNMDAPEHKPTGRIIKQIVRDKALEARVTVLEGAEIVSPIVNVELPPRARITSVAIQYDSMGHPKLLVPAYSE